MVFDLDGTLVDTVDLWAKVWSEALSSYGINISEEQARAYVGLPPSGIIGKVLGQSNPELEESIIRNKTKLMWDYLPLAKPFSDVDGVLGWLKSNKIKIIVASSSTEEWIETMLRKIGADKTVDGYISGTKVKNPKPAPDVFIEAFKMAGVNPAQGMVVGDRETDTIPGSMIGSISVLIDRLNEFKQPKADFVVHKMEEIEEIIGSLSQKNL
ncbi:MAG: HAD family hydrolase [Candidatus Micrarchaeia archaeon]